MGRRAGDGILAYAEQPFEALLVLISRVLAKPGSNRSSSLPGRGGGAYPAFNMGRTVGGTPMLRSLTTRNRVTISALLMAVLVPAAARAADPQAPPRPKIAVLVSVQGLGAEQFERYRPWYVSGLKRLLGEGRVGANCRFHHLLTEDAPGDASVATGAVPRVHGIVTDRWLERREDGREGKRRRWRDLQPRVCPDSRGSSPS